MIRVFADTNWLAALYFNQPSRSRILRSWSRKHRPVMLIGLPVLLEARNVFARVSQKAVCSEWRSLLDDCGNGLQVAVHGWQEIADQAEGLIDRYAHKTAISTADCLVVASAFLSGAGWFLSFDQKSGARALASRLNMKVFPELSEEDKKIASRLKP